MKTKNTQKKAGLPPGISSIRRPQKQHLYFMLTLLGLLCLFPSQKAMADNDFWAKKKATAWWDGSYMNFKFLTYETDGEDDHIVNLEIYLICGGIEEKVIWMKGAHNDHFCSTERKFKKSPGWASFYPDNDNKYNGGDKSQSWMLVQYDTPKKYWGNVKVRFKGRFAYEGDNSNGVNFNFVVPDDGFINLGSPRFTNAPSVVSTDRTSPTTVVVNIKNLPNVPGVTEQRIYNQALGKHENHSGGTTTSTFNTDNLGEISSGFYSDIYYGTNKNTPYIAYKVPAFATAKNVNFTFEQYNQHNKVTWEVNNPGGYGNICYMVYRSENGGAWTCLSSTGHLYFYDSDGVKANTKYRYAIIPYRNIDSWTRPTVGKDGTVYSATKNTTTSFSIDLKATQGTTEVPLNWTYAKTDLLSGCKFEVYVDNIKTTEVNYDTSGASSYKVTGLTSGNHTYQVKLISSGSWFGKNFESNKITQSTYVVPLISRLSASKNVYPDRIQVEWDVQNNSEAGAKSQYMVSRRSLENENSAFREVYRTSSEEDYLYWTDDQVLPGVYYEYKIDMISTAANKTSTLATTYKDVGFCMSAGNIAGRITYGSGTAVQDVAIRLQRNGESNDVTTSRALSFNGLSSATTLFTGDQIKSIFNTSDFSFQMWLNPSLTGEIDNEVLLWDFHCIFTLSLYRKDNTYYELRIGTTNVDWGKQAVLADSILIDTYQQVTITRKCTPEGNVLTGYVTRYRDADTPVTYKKETKFASTNPFVNNSYLGLDRTFNLGGYYKGLIDEFRIWSKCLTDEEIQGNFDRLLAGNENGLEAYWRFDEGLDGMFFDSSRKGSVQNGHHGTLSAGVEPTTEVPANYQLALKGITDKDGNYLISGVPFGGDGTSYSVVPLMGVHEFEPSQQLRYVSANSLVHNSTDFKDISSFKVNGRVTYEGGEYPVEGVSVSVDGQIQMKEGKIVQSDAQGNFQVDVPIGNHYISLSKAGHTFANDGRYPSGQGTYVNFQNDILSPITFQDETKCVLVGRVIAGGVEAAKNLGFGHSKTHIGKATLEIVPLVTNYWLNSETTTVTANDSSQVVINSNTTLAAKSCTIQVETDSKTGEFKALLPPIDYKINSVSTQSVVASNFTDKLMQFTLDPNQTTTLIDTLYNEAGAAIGVDSLVCNDKVDFVYYSPIHLEVVDSGHLKSTTPTAFGDSVYAVGGSTKAQMRLVDKNAVGGGIKYLLGYPVFMQGSTYNFLLKGYEQYVNEDGGQGVVTTVPTTGATITPANNLSCLQVAGTSLTNTSNSLILDDKGLATYRFMAGFPNILGDHTLTCELVMTHNGRTDTWKMKGNAAENNKGIVLGSIPKDGNDFTTRGPSIVDFVLHDPPGSNSYAYLEKGSSFQKHYSLEKVGAFEQNVGVLTSLGAATINGIGVMVETEIINQIEAGVKTSAEVTSSKSYNYTVETIESIKTGSSVEVGGSSDYVGSGGDIFMGSNTNVTYSNCSQVGLFHKNQVANLTNSQDVAGTDYTLGTNEAISIGMSFDTRFQYTEVHIESVLIPNIKKVRRSLLTHVDNYPENPTKGDTARYLTTKSLDDPCWDNDTLAYKGAGKSTFDYMYVPSTKKSNYNKIAAYDADVVNWTNVLAKNEEDKVNTFKAKSKQTCTYKSNGGDISFDFGFIDNHSFDAGSTLERATTRSAENENGNTNSFLIQGYMDLTIGAEIGGAGVQAHVDVSEGGGQNREHTTTEMSSTTFGYVLADPDRYNYLSIDVFLPGEFDKKSKDTTFLASAKGGHSYMFRLRGGQSSCPYEGPTETKYYMPGTKLDEGAQQLNLPSIQISSSSNLVSLPSGYEASFDVLLGNANTQYTQEYMLWYIEKSNPDGLIITLDGASLAYGRSFEIEPGTTIRKTLKVKQSKLGVLEYKDIVLKFGSDCDEKVYVTTPLTVTFVPSSSNVKLSIPNPVLNCTTGNELSYVISDFDVNYNKFAGIQLKYKREGETSWTLVKEYVNDVTLMPLVDGKNVKIADVINEGKINDTFTLPQEGTYTVAAVSIAREGALAKDITVWSEEIDVTYDSSRPESMGTPSPATGILTADGEISLTFNENIVKSAVTQNFMQVVGELNGYDLKHNVGVKLAAGAPATTAAPFAFNGTPIAIEMWVQRTPGQTGTLFAQGTNFELGFTAEDKVTMKLNGTTYTSEKPLPSANWQYISACLDPNTGKLTVYALYETTTAELINKTVTADYVSNERLTFGAKADGTERFTGSIHEVTLWNTVRELTDLADRDKAKTGRETGLAGYWRMDEGRGATVYDRVRERHITLPTVNNWYLNNVNFAAELDGKSGIELPADQIMIGADDDFALEFWFKGAEQSKAATLFSIGDGIIDYDVEGKLSIGFTAEKELVLKAGGDSTILSTTNYQDNAWHHLLLNVTRGGYAILHMDGQLVKRFSSGSIGMLVNDRYAVGKRLINKGTHEAVADQFFTGSIDEVRLWQARMSTEMLELNRYNRLLGTETGLVLYYPFEHTYLDSGNQPQVEGTLIGMQMGTSATATSTANFSKADAPALKEARAVQNVAHTFTVSDNKILITITEPAYRIENCTMEFTVSRATDISGNIMNPVTWTAYVDANRLLWGEESISLVNELQTPRTVTLTLQNKSGKEENWVISNIPSWLSIAKTSGTLKPLTNETLTATIMESTPIGSYEQVLYLTGSNLIDEPLPISLKVTGIRPDWAVNPNDFESSMNLIANLLVENVPTEDEADLVAAFMGDQCVGLASPTFVEQYNTYLVMMDIYGNEVNAGDEVVFKVWDASTGRTYPTVVLKNYAGVVQTMEFEQQLFLGMPNEPYCLNAENILEQTLNLKKGWNWVSLNVNRNFNSQKEQMYPDMVFDKVKNSVIMIKSQAAGSVDYGATGWGTNSPFYNKQLSTRQMYLAYMKENATLPIVGGMVKPDTAKVVMAAGWNWISYSPQDAFDLPFALSGFTPETGDIIKGQSQYAFYDGSCWIGSLKYLQPGKGYMYKTSAAKEFFYPAAYAGTRKAPSMERESSQPIYWTCNYHQYPNNMTLIAQVVDANGQKLMEGEVSAFAGDECRGVQVIHNGMVYLTICGDNKVDLTFRIYDARTQEISEVNQGLAYSNNAMYGSSAEPYQIQLKPTNVEALKAHVQVNMTESELQILADEPILSVTLTTASGQIVVREQGTGSNQMVLPAAAWDKGVYFVTISTSHATVTVQTLKP